MKTVSPSLTTVFIPPNASKASRAIEAKLSPRIAATWAFISYEGPSRASIPSIPSPPAKRYGALRIIAVLTLAFRNSRLFMVFVVSSVVFATHGVPHLGRLANSRVSAPAKSLQARSSDSRYNLARVLYASRCTSRRQASSELSSIADLVFLGGIGGSRTPAGRLRGLLPSGSLGLSLFKPGPISSLAQRLGHKLR
jgi:hypothetical protein